MSNRDLEDVARILNETVAEQERQAELERRLRDPVLFHRDLLHLSLENRHNGEVWLTLGENTGHGTMRRFIREPSFCKFKMILASRGCGKTKSVALPYVVERVLADHTLTVLLGGERAIEVQKRSLWLRTRMEELHADYGPLIDKDRWAADQWSVIRPGGRGLQDTITVGSPDKPGTSQHWRLGVFDDPVGDWTAESAARGRRGIKWFKELQNQALEGSEILVFCTLWPGDNIITWIIRELEGGLALKPYGCGYVHRGHHFDILVIRDRDEQGNPIFPSQSDDYLAAKEEVIGPEMYRSQYSNFMLGMEDLAFHGAKLIEGEDAPKKGMRIYILNDVSPSTRATRHTSIAAIFVVGKDSNDHAWMLDGAAGKLGWDRIPDIIIDFWLRWHPERIPYENTGPAQALPTMVEKAAFARKLDGRAIRRLFFPIPRTADKHSRIQAARSHVMEPKLHFTKTFPPSLFRIDRRGTFRGTLGEELSNYTFGADQELDCLDVIADIWGYWGAGFEIFPAPKSGKKPRKKLVTPEDFMAYAKQYYDSMETQDGHGAD